MRKMTLNQALQKAHAAYTDGKLEVAKRLLARILQIEPNNADANHNMGHVLAKSGNVTEAIPYFKTALEANFSVSHYWFSFSNALFKVGRYNEAAELLAIARTKGCHGKAFDDLETELNSDEIELRRRIERLQEADFGERVSHFKFFGIGEAWQKLGKLEEAIEAYNKALAIKPDYAEAHSNMGVTLKDQGKLEEAIEAYKKALAIKPDYAEAHNNMGNALEVQGKLEEALEAYKKSLGIKPEYAIAARNLVKLPVGSIDEETILGLNKLYSVLSTNIQDKSQRLFFEANLFTHKGEYEEAFKRFVEANHIKSKEITSVVKNLTHNYHKIVNRIQRWSPQTLKHTEPSLKTLFLLGPSRSGKSSLEKLLMRISKIYPMYENISLATLNKSDVRGGKVKSFDITELFYHDEKNLLDDGYSFVTSTSPESMFHIDQLLDGLVNSFCVLVKRNPNDVASEIFTQEYENGNFFSYTPSSIQDYLNTYSVIWEEIKRKAPNRTLEIEYEDILIKPKEVLYQINQFTRENLILDNAEQYSTEKRISPFREHYAQKFKSSINQGFEIQSDQYLHPLD
jgi:tetratricopeptide (TPR) repeat protein